MRLILWMSHHIYKFIVCKTIASQFLKHNKHPESIPVPCCFTNYSRNMKGVFNTLDDEDETPNTYIKGSNKLLNPGRIGLLRRSIYTHFKMDNRFYTR